MSQSIIEDPSAGLPNSLQPYFVATEIKNTGSNITKLLANRSFEADLAIAREASRDSLYATWNDKIGSSLAAAYPLYLHLLADPQLADQILADPYFAPEGGSRKRRPTKGKSALLVLQYVTRPFGVDNLKSCSAYSAMLELAKDRQVSPQEFASTMAKSTLKEALAYKRGDRRRTLRARTFRIRLSGGMGPTVHKDILVPAVIDQAFFGRVADAMQQLLRPSAEAPDHP